MRKLMILAVLALAVPAMAGSVVVTGADDDAGGAGLTGTITYAATGGLARAFALDVSVSAGTITGVSVTGMQPYRIFMGSIVITNGVVTNWGGPVAPSTDPGTCGQLNSSCVTIEMGSLYDPDNASDPNKPAASGNLVRITASAACTVNMAANATRGGVVMEDATAASPLTLTSFALVSSGGPCFSAGKSAAVIADWVAYGSPTCWCNKYQCDGDADNIAEGISKYRVFGSDLNIMLANWKKKMSENPNPCADFDHKAEGISKYRVFGSDLNRLLANWKKKDTQLAGDCQTRPE